MLLSRPRLWISYKQLYVYTVVDGIVDNCMFYMYKSVDKWITLWISTMLWIKMWTSCKVKR